MLWQSNQIRIRYCYNHLEWPPRIMGFIHSRNVCHKEVIIFNRLWEECTQEEAQLIIREEKMGATKDQALTTQRRSLKRWGIWRTQFLKSLLSMKQAEGSRRSLSTKQIKISFQLSSHDIVLIMHLFIFSWCIMHVCINNSILLICMWWVSSSWCYTTLHCYLSRMTPLC